MNIKLYHSQLYVLGMTRQDHPREFTSMIWTIHFAYDNYGWPSFERVAALINDTGRSTSQPPDPNETFCYYVQELMSSAC